MSNLLLAKPILPCDFIDTSVGEPHIIRDILLSIFAISNSDLTHPKIWEYGDPHGYQPLVSLLENKYQAPVIITNGAKNALGAAMFALKQMGKDTISLPNPWWCLLPPLIEMHGLKWNTVYEKCNSHLLVVPNNPNGWMPTSQFIDRFEQECKYKNQPIIDDAVYNSSIYLPSPVKPFGDAQIYSASKYLGLSSLRVGWIVCSNQDLYKHMLYYMEHMTVGVSVVSQILLHDLLKGMYNNPTLTKEFEQTAASSLKRSKEIMLKVRPEILEIPENLPDVPGMFLWAKVGPACDFKQAKINVIDGALFGVPGFVRMNLAFHEAQMIEVVHRLNSIK